jgi:hypothetical protein
MSNVKDAAAMFEATLKGKYFNTPVKAAIQIPRKLALALALSVEYAATSSDPANLVRKILSEEDRGKLAEFTLDILRKGDVEDFYATMKETMKT